MPTKKRKPTSPGSRYRVTVMHPELHKGEPEKSLIVKKTRIDGRNVVVAATEGGFELSVVGGRGNNVTAPLPAANASVTVRGITFVREGDAVFAERGETRVRIAQRERYEGRQ